MRVNAMLDAGFKEELVFSGSAILLEPGCITFKLSILRNDYATTTPVQTVGIQANQFFEGGTSDMSPCSSLKTGYENICRRMLYSA
jgi:hypothetical protein